MFSSKQSLPRQHLLFPTNQEAIANSSLVNSDHLPILGKVPLGNTGDELKIASLNTLAATSFSGFNGIPSASDRINQGDNTGEYKRYDRMMAGLVNSTVDHGVDVIFLQETNEELAQELLQQKLQSGWIIKSQNAMLIAYNGANYKEMGKPDNSVVTQANGLMSLTLKHKTTKHTIDLHNIWGEYSPDEHDRLEDEYRQLLNRSSSDRTVFMLGDTNDRIAPLHDMRGNITTGIVPTYFNSQNGIDDKNYQLSDFPDGGFYRTPDGEIKQIETKVLDFKTANIVIDKRKKEEIKPHSRQVRVLTLDAQYDKEKKKFQEILDETLGKKISFSYEVTSNSFNEKETCLRFENKHDYDNFVASLTPLSQHTHLHRENLQRLIRIPRLELKAAIRELKYERDFKTACRKLDDAVCPYALTDDDLLHNSKVKAAGKEVLDSVIKAKKEGKIKLSELPKYTKFVEATTDVVEATTDSEKIKTLAEKINTHAQNTKEVIKMNPISARFISTAMLSFLGVALIAFSVAVAVATFGASTPLSAIGLALGGSIVATSAALSVTAASGFSLAITAGIFAHRARKGDIGIAGERVQEEALRAQEEVGEVKRHSRN